MLYIPTTRREENHMTVNFKSALAALAGLAIIGIGSIPADAQPVLWSSASGGNGHYYDIVPVSVARDWFSSNTAAQSTVFMGAPGYLATVTSAAEEHFLTSTFGSVITGRGFWLGGFQPPGSPEPDGGFQWVTGEAFVYTDWNPLFPPNNSFGTEDGVTLVSDWTTPSGFSWNDLTRVHFADGYIVEFEPPPGTPPTANAGPDVRARLSGAVFLNGLESFDDNTSNNALVYAWSFTEKPAGSTAVLLNADTGLASFTVDAIGTYRIKLIVTDTDGLVSGPDEVIVSSDNLAPSWTGPARHRWRARPYGRIG
jgi:hypothetical protein